MLNTIEMGLECPYCGEKSELIDSAWVYNGTSYGWMYICKPCDAYVGCHKGTSTSLGRLANETLRKLKGQAHLYFDNSWKSDLGNGKSKGEVRTTAYEWLSKKLDLPIEKTHIGMFDEETCKKVISLYQL